MTQVPPELVRLAGRLADTSGAILRRYFRSPLAADRKHDNTPVTAADREAEEAIRELLADAVPEHGVMGEEFGAERVDAEFLWVVDPIDGTKSFVTGKPLFGTLIACVRNGTPIIGIIDQPVLGERWLGVAGSVTTMNSKPVRVRACGELSEAMLYATSPHMFQGADAAAFERVRARVAWPNYGADCYAYGLLASGFCDLVVEATLKPHDFCALVPVIAGADGLITDWSGAPLGPGSDGRVIAAGDRRVHRAALALLNGDD